MGAPARLLSTVGLIRVYPVVPEQAKTWYRRRLLSRYRMVEHPFAAYPYLCMSTEMEVTPGTLKSKSGTG